MDKVSIFDMLGAAALADSLHRAGVETKAWGSGNYKSVHDLYRAFMDCEAALG